MEAKLYYWRTTAGSEVDLIISKGVKPVAAIEIKAKKKIGSKDLAGLRSFLEEYEDVPNVICVSEVDAPYAVDNIMILPWRYFLEKKLPKILNLKSSRA